MHSSRMRTALLLPVSPSMQCSLRDVPGPGGCTWSQGVYLVSQGVYLVPGGVPGGGVYLVWECTWSQGVYLVPGRGTWFLGWCTWSRGVNLVPGGCTWCWESYLVQVGGGVPAQVLMSSKNFKKYINLSLNSTFLFQINSIMLI